MLVKKNANLTLLCDFRFNPLHTGNERPVGNRAKYIIYAYTFSLVVRLTQIFYYPQADP